MAELSNFQKNFLAGSGHVQVFTQKEFDEALAVAKAEIMHVAIETTKQAIHIEREECAKLVDEWTGEVSLTEIAKAILNRIPAQRQ
jgi:hypothetical protein